RPVTGARPERIAELQFPPRFGERAMADQAREQPSPLVELAALAPDAAFAAARMFQRAAFGAFNRGARLTGAVAGAVASTPPVRGSLRFVESQLQPLAERGTVERHEDEQ